MKRIRHHRLRKGPPGRGRIVEVDLIEVEATGISTDGTGYLVPFRSGREGQALQEGTRTTLPVSRQRAERILARELQRRRDDGYTVAGDTAPGTASPPHASPSRAAPAEAPLDSRRATLLAHIQRPGYAPPGRRRSRIVQRVGDLRIHEARTALVSELPTAKGTHRIVLAGALARVAAPEVAGALHTLAVDPSEPVQRFATAGLLAIPSEAPAVRQAILDDLPGGIARSVHSAEALAPAIESWLARDGAERPLVLVSLYLLNDDPIREVLLHVLHRIDLRAPSWRAVRRLYKLAELRDDGAVLGLLVRRIETRAAQPRTSWMYTWTRESGRVSIVDEIRRGSDRWGYTVATRAWFRKRAVRTLQRRGFDASPAYVDLALGTLAAFDRHEAGRLKPPVDFLLRANRHGWYASSVYGPWPGFTAPRAPHPPTRPEAFPELWDARPDALLKLALGGHTETGIAVGCHALSGRPDLSAVLSVANVLAFVSSARSDQRALGLQGAQAHWDPAHPSRDLLVALASSPDAAARALAHDWIRSVSRAVLTDPTFLVTLLLSPAGDTRALARELVPAARTIPGVQGPLVTELLARLAALAPADPDPGAEVVADTLALLTGPLADALRMWPYDTLATLLDAPRLDVRRLGAALLHALTLPAEQLPQALLARWTTDGDPAVRALGIAVFGRLPEPVLKGKVSVLVAMLSSPVPPVRDAIAPTIARLVADPVVAAEVFDLVLALVLRDDVDEGVQAELVAFAEAHLQSHLDRIAQHTIFRLLAADGAAAQTLGAGMLGRLRPAALTADQLVVLADHDMQLVRATAGAWAAADAPRVCREDVHLLRLIDAAWPDTRALGARLLREQRPPDVLDPALLIAICDSPRAEVQALGRQLIPELFQREFGPLLLARLAEHPSVAMQAFVSGLLPGHAAGHSDRIRALAPYFAAVLGGVSRGGVAKARVFAFLDTELQRDPELARWALPLLERASGSVSIQDRARAIALLSATRRTHGIDSSVVTVLSPTHRGEAPHGV